MTTIKLAVLRHTKAKDGTYKIRISIGHKSETHYIVTRYKVNSLANFKDGIVINQSDSKQLNIKLRQLLNEYDERLERIPQAGALSCEQLRNLLRDMPSADASMTLSQVMQQYTDNLTKEGRTSTANLIRYHVGRFLDWNNGDIFLSHISTLIVDNYLHYLRSRHYSPSYISISITPLRTLVNYAVKMQYVRYEVNPFAYYKQPEIVPRELDIPVDDMRKLMSYRPLMRKTQRTLELFLLSFYLGGMNLIDLLEYDFRNTDIIDYRRRKTKLHNTRNTVFSIPDEAKPIISRWVNPQTGRIFMLRTSDYHCLLSDMNRSLKTIARNAGLSCRRISFYSARKSFVQYGFEQGIPLEILEYCSGQTMKSNRPIFNYFRVMQQQADTAIRRVIDYVKSPLPSQATDIE